MVGEGRRLEGADHFLAGTAWTAGIDEKGHLGSTLSRFALERQGDCWTVRIIPIQRHRDVCTLERPAVMPRNLARQVPIYSPTSRSLTEGFVVSSWVHHLPIRALRTFHENVRLRVKGGYRRIGVSLILSRYNRGSHRRRGAQLVRRKLSTH